MADGVFYNLFMPMSETMPLTVIKPNSEALFPRMGDRAHLIKNMWKP